MQYTYITIEGNIGAGKTTLTHLLQQKLNAKLVLEQFADNPFLPKFYKDRDKYAFPLELSFLAERYRQLRDMLNTRDLFSDVILSDYLFIKCKLFARVNLPDEEYKLFETLFDIIYPNLPQPELVIFLDAPLQKLRQNIRARNRSYEQDIPDQYLVNIQEAYMQHLNANQYRTLVVDTSKTDFLNEPRHLELLMEQLSTPLPVGRHFFNF